ncbi:aspartate 1-decarboxylase [Alkalicoccobacillus murimartini]|uniref:Aspartate 1-decarboxylase n=1 Tax=Alkalicoccobacillus murimartini TaxID=171685 RepID=A0ABT9YEI1_9BACI|nr:aspartate 1-decarboxylase [Alkalicoccobacillus murimartini]MDQ0205951.1 aspartate 1-decarboxylase [Alkalicoccobacillus murimartini]
MFVTMMKSKIHRATITESDLNYVGSITIDEDIMKAVNILENEKVQIVNNHNGARFETYVIKGEAGSGQICVNGAAARLVQPGDTIIIIAYAMMEAAEAKEFHPQVAIMNQDNQIDQLLGTEPAYTVL